MKEHVKLSTITAILVISAHWEGPGLAVTANDKPKMIYDFYGFDDEFYEIKYPASGSYKLCQRVQSLLAPEEVRMGEDWGLDHGAWAVLKHIIPEANIPVVQL